MQVLHRLPRAVPAAVVLLTGLTVLTFTHGALGTAARPAAHQPVRLTMLPPLPSDTAASRSRAPAPASRFHGVVVPDLLVTVSGRVSPSQLRALHAIKGMKAVAGVATGRVNVGTASLDVMAVAPADFRSLTPRETAASDALWAAVDRGELASSYAARLPLGTDVATGPEKLPIRVGALASFGLPMSDVVVNDVLGQRLGLRADSVLLAAPDRRLRSFKRDVRAVLGQDATVQVLRPVAITYRRPATYKDLYILSARYCPGLSWKVLAAIGQVESGHGRNVGPSSAGALGPMQFLPSTWVSAGVDGDGDGKADIMSAYDAVPAAALYLCRNGAGQGGQSLYNAIFSYNHADWYVRKVLDLAARYQ